MLGLAIHSAGPNNTGLGQLQIGVLNLGSLCVPVVGQDDVGCKEDVTGSCDAVPPRPGW